LAVLAVAGFTAAGDGVGDCAPATAATANPAANASARPMQLCALIADSV
jgi:hypothetical protein